MTEPKVYIVILNWNGWRDTVECLESVYQLKYENFQVVVCDNESTDGSVDKINSWSRNSSEARPSPSPKMAHLSDCGNKPKPEVRTLNFMDATTSGSQIEKNDLVVIKTGGNLGFAGGNNVGLKYALNCGDADYIWLLNNDTVVEPEALGELVTQSKTLSDAGTKNTCGSLVCFYDDPDVIQALGGSTFNYRTGIASQSLGRYRKRSETIDHKLVTEQLDFVTGCSWLLPIDFLHDIGLMEESYFLYFEEMDWIVRSRSKYAITYAPDSVVYHKEGSSIGSKTMNRGPSTLSEHYNTVSRIQFMRLHFPKRLPWVYGAVLLQAANRLRQGMPKNSWAIIKALFTSLTRRTDSQIPAA